jgi:hypothetical protein
VIGTIPAGITALNWSGGRGISAEAGSDRKAAWGTELMLIRSHPIFGVGFERFTEYNEITAHNTVVCNAELGLTGFFFWVLFTLPMVRGVLFTGYTPKQQADDSEAARDEVLQPVAPGMMASAEPAPMPDRSSAGSLYQEAVAASPYFMNEEEQETLPKE